MNLLLETIRNDLKEQAKTIDQIRPLALAYIGDTVLDLYVRSQLVIGTSLHPKEMHKAATGIVNAASQAKMMKYLLDDLSEEEKDVFRHGRNQHSGTIPKNQSPVDYKWATGFEALLGYLFLTEKDERMIELMRKGTEYLKAEKEKTHE